LRALRERKLAPLNGAGASGLWMVLERAMSHASEERFASADEFAATLRLWLRARGLREDLKGDSLPEHWAVRGSVVHRAFCRSERRVAGEQAAASGRRRLMPGSLTLVDPRVPVHEGSHARTRTHALAASVAPKRPLILWAAAASMLCATLALLHARADAGNTSASRPRKLGSLAAEAAPQPQLRAADHSSLRAQSELAPGLQPSQHVSTPAAASVEPEPKKPGLRRATTGRSRAAHSGSSSRAPANMRHAEANRLGLKSPW
jgi:hypothetical protein